MGYEWSVCYKRLTDGGMVPCDSMNLAYHCESFMYTSAYHNSCTGQAVYQPVQALVCRNCQTKEIKVFASEKLIDECMKLNKQDHNWGFYQCYCCCSCFANGTLIEAPQGPIEVEKIVCGGEILAGSLKPGDKPEFVWKSAAVEFSAGTVGGEQPAMVYIIYGDKREIIVSPDHVFMLSGGKLTTAGKLKPGDQLVDKNGKPVPILTASIGHYQGGVHHISTGTGFDGSLDNHLLISGGIVSGDYTLQLYFDGLDQGVKVSDDQERPVMGSKEHREANRALMNKNGIFFFAAKAGEEELAVDTVNKDGFKAYQLAEPGIPYGAKALFSQEQAADIFNNGTQFPLHVTIGFGGAQYLIKLFKGFYPDVNVFLEWERFEPNLYAFEQFGQKVVLVSGGLVRMKGLEMEGLALLIGQGIARFYGGAPKSRDGYACTGTADFYAASAISRKIWFGNQWMDLVLAGYNQVVALFGLISPENGQGNPLDICGEPGIACRLQTVQSGIAGGNLPSCAGGEEKPKLALETAAGTAQELTLTFNLGLEISAAVNTANYKLSPAAEIKEAAVDSKRNFIVKLAVEVEKGQEYTIKVQNLFSAYGTELDPAQASCVFTAAE